MHISKNKYPEDVLKSLTKKHFNVRENSSSPLDQYLLNVLMDNIPDAVYFKDLDSRFIKVNKAKMKKVGVVSENEVLGKTDLDFFEFEHANDARNEELQIIRTGEPIANKIEKEIWPDGRITWVSTTKAPLKDSEGNIIGTFGISRDMTELKEKEKDIQSYIGELETKKNLIEESAEELSLLNSKLMESEARLRELNSSKDTFFSIISHDLRSPFTSMLGISEFLIRDIDELSNEEIKSYAGAIQGSAKCVYKLLENLLEWSNVQTGRINKEPVEIKLTGLIQDILRLYKVNVDKKEIEFITCLDDKIIVLADRNMLDTVIRNLVSNAIKFSFCGGKVNIKTEVRGDDVIVSIKDEGTGISTGDLSGLFKIDKRVSRYGTSNETGTGLGLILCKEFIEAHGGKIWVESKEGEGSTFFFSLPFHEHM